MFNCVDYVIMHKDWKVQEDDLYKALCVGGFRKDPFLCEMDGENIAEYNDRLNELTGLYWIWKNTSSEYVGLSHYRRFFDDGGKRIGKERIREILQDERYDIILAEPVRLDWTVRNNIVGCMGYELDRKAYDAYTKAIRKRQPEYLDDFVQVMDGNSFHVCNMFVSSRKIMNEFCEWLFSFLTEAADMIDVAGMDYYQRRTPGYYAEALWSVWLMSQRYRVKNLPVMRRG